MATEPWKSLFDRWLEPFLRVWGDKRRRTWAPLYLQGLLLPAERKSIAPMAARLAPKDEAQLHHFVADSPWSTEPLAAVLLEKLDAMLGGPSAFVIVDDTALPKKGEHSVGVAPQYCSALGKQANCQVLVSLTLAREDIPAPLGLRLFLPEVWACDHARRQRAKVPDHVVYQPKWQIALEQIDQARAGGLRFGAVLADAGYGACAEFRHGLSERELRWAVGILSTQNVYPVSVTTTLGRAQSRGRRRTRPLPTERPCAAAAMIDQAGRFRTIRWRTGSKGVLQGTFALLRVRPADADTTQDRLRLPGEEAWLVCEQRSGGERKYYLSNFPASASARSIVAAIKARWACEQAHQQMKEELGLDHFEARSWRGLHHHALLTMMAFAFLVHLRFVEKKPSTQPLRTPAHPARPTALPGAAFGCVETVL